MQNDFINGDFLQKNLHNDIDSFIQFRKRDKTLKIALGSIYILLLFLSLIII